MPRKSWYRRWFGEEYLSLYPHRDQAEAGRAVELVLRAVDAPGRLHALDLACGAGRHLTALAARDVEAVGLDLSYPLLRRAIRAGAAVVRGDMRELPFADAEFSLVTNFFTSFGYFQEPAEDERVLAEVRRVLALGGAFAFDFLNAERVRGSLPARSERQVDGRRVLETRYLTEADSVVEKRIDLHDPADRFPHTFYERVRLYSARELQALLTRHALVPTHRFGDYNGAPLSPASPRVILIGRAT